MEKKWIIKERGDNVTVKQLAGELGVSESLANLMIQRNITTPEEAHAFFNPSLDYLHDPFLMKDMNIAVDRLSTAIKKNEKILVYGDYDVDGTTAVALVYSFLIALPPAFNSTLKSPKSLLAIKRKSEFNSYWRRVISS